MPKMMVSVNALKIALGDTIPILKNTDTPILMHVSVQSENNKIYMSCTDRYVAWTSVLTGENVSDKRRVNINLTIDQLLLLRAWLNFMKRNSNTVEVSITDKGIKFDPDSLVPLSLLAADCGQYPNIRNILKGAIEDAETAEPFKEAKGFNPVLVKHIHKVKLWASGSDNRPSLLESPHGFGMIMPLRSPGIEVTTANIRESAPGLFDDPTEVTEPEAKEPKLESVKELAQ